MEINYKDGCGRLLFGNVDDVNQTISCGEYGYYCDECINKQEE